MLLSVWDTSRVDCAGLQARGIDLSMRTLWSLVASLELKAGFQGRVRMALIHVLNLPRA